jgi:predicted  nucleic acid-binding Zn-ribbon protein
MMVIEEPKVTDGVQHLESRVARLEAHVENISEVCSDIKLDVRRLDTKLDDFRKDVDRRFEGVNSKFDGINSKFEALNSKIDSFSGKIAELKVWTLTVVAGGVLTIVARALHWI